MYGLSDKTISALKSVFMRYPQIDQAIIYGSRARGDNCRGSDIDITLKGEGLTLQTLPKLDCDIDDLLLPYLLDINVFDKLNNPLLIEIILRDGKVLYQSKNDKLKFRSIYKGGTKGTISL